MTTYDIKIGVREYFVDIKSKNKKQTTIKDCTLYLICILYRGLIKTDLFVLVMKRRYLSKSYIKLEIWKINSLSQCSYVLYIMYFKKIAGQNKQKLRIRN